MDIISRTFSTKYRTLPRMAELRKYIDVDQDYLPSGAAGEFSAHLSVLSIRDEYVDRSFCILSQDFMQAIVRMASDLKIKKTAELCCGGGWLSYWLKHYGLNVQSSDNQSWHKVFKLSPQPIVKMDAAKYVRMYPVQLYILSWPDYGSDVAYRVWRSMKRGQYLLFIGEDEGGCTANDAFFKAVRSKEISDIWGLEKNFIAFWGIHDRPILYQK